MGIVLLDKKGFTLLEMLISLLIISIMLLIGISSNKNVDLDHYYFMNDYLYNQSKALLERENISYKKGIYFNSMGHVNQAKTLEISNHEIIIHLGNGYATIK